MSPADAGASLEADSLLRQFICAEDEVSSESILERLLSEHAEPLIRRTVYAKLRSGRLYSSADERQDEGDICHNVIVHLIRRLRDFRASGDPSAIAGFRPYVLTCAQNAYYGYLQVRHPVRFRFKNSLRYLLNHTALFE